MTMTINSRAPRRDMLSGRALRRDQDIAPETMSTAPGAAGYGAHLSVMAYATYVEAFPLAMMAFQKKIVASTTVMWTGVR